MNTLHALRDNRTGKRPSTIVAGVSACLAATAVVSLGGCASPGPPRPPSLRLPQPVTDLTAQRVGEQVILHWTTPGKTTDGLLLPDSAAKSTLTARICRAPIPTAPLSAAPAPKSGLPLAPTFAPPLPSRPAPPCNVVLRVPVHPGASAATDPLPASLTADPVALLDYRVEIENAATRTAGPSNPAFAVAGSAPSQVESLHASAIPAGAMVEWAPSASVATARPPVFLDLDRIDQALLKPAKSKPGQPLQLAGQEPAEVHLRASGIATGTIDPSARFGQTYTYTAQRVRPVQLNGHPLEIRSVASPAITLTVRDVFPPAVPTGLATIPTAAPQPGSQPGLPSGIDLSWQPNTEPDLAGYLVYRRAVAGPATPSERLTPNPIPGAAFHDRTATAGRRYAYSVTAVDTDMNESKPSPEVEETLPNP